MSSDSPDTAPYDRDYGVPSVGEMIKHHTLSYHIMHTRDPQGNGWAVFDHSNLVSLRRFIDDPTQKDDMLREMGMQEAIEAPEVAASQHRSLVGYIVARHGTQAKTDEQTGDVVSGTGPVFTGGEIEELRKWFESGAWDIRDEA